MIYTAYSTEGQPQEVRGYTLPFALHAEPEVQQFIFNCGLGEFTRNGFGMLDLAYSKPTERTVPYSKEQVDPVYAATQAQS